MELTYLARAPSSGKRHDFNYGSKGLFQNGRSDFSHYCLAPCSSDFLWVGGSTWGLEGAYLGKLDRLVIFSYLSYAGLCPMSPNPSARPSGGLTSKPPVFGLIGTGNAPRASASDLGSRLQSGTFSAKSRSTFLILEDTSMPSMGVRTCGGHGRRPQAVTSNLNSSTLLACR